MTRVWHTSLNAVPYNSVICNLNTIHYTYDNVQCSRMCVCAKITREKKKPANL